MKFKTITIILLTLLIIGCKKDIVVDDSASTPEGVAATVNANNKFAFDLYNYYKDSEDNIFFSPYSISTALAMTYEGSRGKTAEEMKSVFYFPEDRRPSYAKIYNDLNKGSENYKLHTANALWAHHDYKFLDDYFNVIEKYYGGKVTNLDFYKSEESRLIINDWVEQQTNDKIKNLIPRNALSPATRLVITNAIYFKGTWLMQFDEKNTRDSDFRITPDNIVKVPMMNVNEEFNYAETDDLQILEMLYDGEDLSMLIFLPKNDLELDADKLNEYLGMLSSREVNVYMPKFTFETKYFMKDTLSEIGMPTAFTGNADFSGMDGTKNLFISSVIHQAFIEVNEEGTEAAAATAVGIALTSAESKVTIFRADHPFIFIILDRNNGNILFMGRVIDPR